MVAWRAAVAGSLSVTHHSRVEIVNAICRGGFLGHLDQSSLSEALTVFSEDFTKGYFVQADILWRAALNRAADLSVQHTPKLGVRALDVLHVACALELKLRKFFTFDVRQQELAKAVGLKLVKLEPI